MNPVPNFDLLDKARRHLRREATPAEVVKHALAMVLDAISDIERRATRATEPQPDSANLIVN